MTYQGHHSDGSSVQKHSAGSHYPFVVGKQEGQRRPWFVMAPSGRMLSRTVECEDAFENAEHFAKQLRRGVINHNGETVQSQPIYVAATGESISVPLNTAERRAVRHIVADPEHGRHNHIDNLLDSR